MISRFSLTRRAALAAGGALLVVRGSARAQIQGAAAIPTGNAEAGVESHGLSTFGDLAEAPDFKSFAYVNPAAPKGGMVGQEMYGTVQLAECLRDAGRSGASG